MTLTAPDVLSAELAEVVDARSNRRGTWQWIVLDFADAQAALGICTWTEGYLAPIYQDVMTGLATEGYDCLAYRKEPDQVIEALLTIHDKLRKINRLAGGF